MISEYYFQFYDDDRIFHKSTTPGKWPFSIIQEACKAWIEDDKGIGKQIKNKDGPGAELYSQGEYNEIKEISQELDVITIIQRTDGTVQLNFPYRASRPYSDPTPNIPPDMEEWLTENTEQKWTYSKWQPNTVDNKIGIEITREDLVALKLKFPL
jgi:hypothetical protein